MVALVLGVALFVYTARDLDVARLRHLLADVGPLLVVAALPWLIAAALHGAAWRQLLAGLGHGLSFRHVLAAFLGSEAARVVAPGGGAVGEGVAALQLRRRFDVPWPAVIASLALKKSWVFVTNAVLIVVLLLLARKELTQLVSSIPRGDAIVPLAAIMAVVLAGTGAFTLAIFGSPGGRAAVLRVIGFAPSRRVRAWVARQADEPMLRVTPARHALAAALLMAQWLMEIFETWLFLRLLGADVSFTQALLLELGGSLVRSLAFVVPGGLGVLDASYVGLMIGMGIADARQVGMAFVVLKRARELLYVVVGFLLLAVARRAHRAITPVEVPT